MRCPLRRALITGITGRDGSYLAELLLSKGYEVHGVIRRASTFNTGRIDHIYVDPHLPNVRMFLPYGDLSTAGRLIDLIYSIRPDEVYHLGAQSHVMVSFENPEYTGDITALGTTRLLDATRRSGVATRFYQASSSEMFGAAPPRQKEQTPFHAFDRPPALLHGQRGIAGNTFQTRRDVRCSLSGGERDPATSHYGNRRVRRGPLCVRRRDLSSRIAEGHCGCKGLRQAEQNSAVGGRDCHKLRSGRSDDHRSDTADAACCGSNVHGSRH
jgi:hypothetical protein